MPHSPHHREKIARHFPVDEDEMHALMALVARPVNQKELNSNPEAQRSLDVEWEKLVKKRAWAIESCVNGTTSEPKLSAKERRSM